jgi:hypothetical protein
MQTHTLPLYHVLGSVNRSSYFYRPLEKSTLEKMQDVIEAMYKPRRLPPPTLPPPTQHTRTNRQCLLDILFYFI